LIRLKKYPDDYTVISSFRQVFSEKSGFFPLWPKKKNKFKKMQKYA